jgi:hypothetical protein
MPMLVSSAASAIGISPATSAERMPASQVTRVGTCRVGWVLANHCGSRPSRLIEYHTLVTPSMNVNITVRMPTTAPTAMTVPGMCRCASLDSSAAVDMASYPKSAKKTTAPRRWHRRCRPARTG